ncbi:5-formyltetrahydrofolate cyclo-ligase isoform X2 [Sceloporus undulatus]|uniref:5-formyltetrahydrofolate cyclo-ligase isoform X2 n=1 Tax=Sceloporus undulatus TaxID=8520 RepID=UPI001C4DA8F6|nr:5-formyltetrahydrofolate cyclo-ligase isoform X2 [Sceloporus undulatus]
MLLLLQLLLLLPLAMMEGRGGGGAGERRSPFSNMASAASLHAAKAALRTQLKHRLKALCPAEKGRQSRLLAAQVIQHAKYQASQRISVFLSMADEVQTEEIIKDIFHRGKDCFIPRYEPQSNHMDMVKLASYEEIASLPLTSWNIHQPDEKDVREEALTAPEGLDLILMPGLGFDKSGNRLGRGKGYYDAYLNRCMQHPKGKPYTIALAFKEQMCAVIPTSENDVKVDEILFEEKED